MGREVGYGKAGDKKGGERINVLVMEGGNRGKGMQRGETRWRGKEPRKKGEGKAWNEKRGKKNCTGETGN